MNVHVHIAQVHIHNHENGKLDEILKLLSNISKTEKKMSQELNELIAKVDAETTVEQSAITLLNELKADLDAAGTDANALKALSAKIGDNTTALANAITANTPAAPTPQGEG